MEYFWEAVFVGCGVGLVWVWRRSGQTGVIKCRGDIYDRNQQPFFYHTLRWFALLVGLCILSMIPFMSGARALFGHG